jgi:hypothetical protein
MKKARWQVMKWPLSSTVFLRKWSISTRKEMRPALRIPPRASSDASSAISPVVCASFADKLSKTKAKFTHPENLSKRSSFS